MQWILVGIMIGAQIFLLLFGIAFAISALALNFRLLKQDAATQFPSAYWKLSPRYLPPHFRFYLVNEYFWHLTFPRSRHSPFTPKEHRPFREDLSKVSPSNRRLIRIYGWGLMLGLVCFLVALAALQIFRTLHPGLPS